MLAAQTAMSLKDVAKLVVGLGNGIGKNKSFTGIQNNQNHFAIDSDSANNIY